MKKSGLWFSLLALVIFISTCDSGSGGGGGGDAGGSVIDISNDCTAAFSFGWRTDNQAKRYQTFNTGAYTKVDAVEVKIRKNSEMDTYNDVSVELYKTDGGVPTDRIAETTIDADSFGAVFSVVRANLSCQGLFPGTEYAVVLGQVDLPDDNAGFEWCNEEIDSELNFGKLDDSTWTDESENVGMGDGWLKVYVSGGMSSSVTSYYTGTITVNVEDSLTGVNCVTAHDSQAVFDVVLENDTSFPSSSGQKWINNQGISVLGSYLKTYTGDGCTGMPNSISSDGARMFALSASDFPVNLIIYTEADKYQLIISGIPFSGCTMQYDSFSSTMTAVILVPLMEVAPVPGDTTVLSGDQTAHDVNGADVQVTWSLTRHSN